MADTLPNIAISENVWVDLYAQSGIATGTQIIVQNVGARDIYLSTKATQPDINADGYYVVERSQEAINDSGDSGAWAYCSNADGLVNVRIA